MRTRVIRIGEVAVGGDEPIRVQSMTTTDTRDVGATAAQVERLVAAGCEIVRVATPSLTEAAALPALRDTLDRRGLRVPLVADVHFAPNAALRALEGADKVRINPGNFVDRKRFEVRAHSDAEYAEELERLAERFAPLVRRARALGRALRIGTNHGSLSDRITNRFGDTPRGMVESALEFLDVCDAEGFRDVVLSMKSSNPVVMVEAYRLLARRLVERDRGEGPPPLHLGVTEAGAGRDGRIKSAIGIGTLLEAGLGDTIRVSLTEDPVHEIPVARALAARGRGADARTAPPVTPERPSLTSTPAAVPPPPPPGTPTPTSPLAPTPIPAARPTVEVELEVGAVPAEPVAAAAALADALARATDRPCEGLLVTAPDAAAWARLPAWVDGLRARGVEAPVRVRTRLETGAALTKSVAGVVHAVGPDTARADIDHMALAAARDDRAVEWSLSGSLDRLPGLAALVVERGRRAGLRPPRFSVRAQPFVPFAEAHRRVAEAVARRDLPPALALRHRAEPGASSDARLVAAAADLGGLLGAGLGACVSIDDPALGPADRLDVAYRILQGARRRTTRAEFIACPSCGRTQFDLETVTARIQRHTAHLRDVKIAVMGCIVNGPGEMADADFGYVGAGPGRIHLYVGRRLAVRSVPAEDAVARLVELITAHGRWVDPPEETRAEASATD